MQRRISFATGPGSARRGALTVEVALIMPIFVLFLLAIMEFGHFCLVTHTLNAAARRAAHLGSFEDVTTAQVKDKAREIVDAAIDGSQATVLVRDGSIFDKSGVDATAINYDSLPPIELADADIGDCFIVQVKVPYDNVSLLPPFFIKGKTIVGQAAMRHE